MTTAVTEPTFARITGPDVTEDFGRFGSLQYDRFLKWKKLPESTIEYDHERDVYTLRAPARFAALLGVPDAPVTRPPLPLAPHLFDYQAWVTARALETKRHAVWIDTGLGKTSVYLEWARQVQAITDGKVLILAPLQLARQVQEMAAAWYGDALPVEHLTSRNAVTAWCQTPGPGLAITNYEKFIPGVMPELRYLAGLVADESSILRTGGGTIKWNLIKSARGIEYKLSCTATPAPNDTMEYASQASFLEKLRSEGDILWTFFQRDKTGTWRVKPHARQAFYQFMASWSVYMRDPARFGWGDILATLPPPVTREYDVPMTDAQRPEMYAILARGKKGMFSDRLGVQERGKLSQLAKGFLYEGTAAKRTARRIPSHKPGIVVDLVRTELLAGRQVLVWTVFDEESAIIAERLAAVGVEGVAMLHGSTPPAERTAVLERFRRGNAQVLISKAELIGYGLNLQFCRSMVFSGFSDSFERMYQAVRRCQRFGQTETVYVHVPYIKELEGVMFENLQAKEGAFMRDVAEMEGHYRAALGLEGA